MLSNVFTLIHQEDIFLKWFFKRDLNFLRLNVAVFQNMIEMCNYFSFWSLDIYLLISNLVYSDIALIGNKHSSSMWALNINISFMCF